MSTFSLRLCIMYCTGYVDIIHIYDVQYNNNNKLLYNTNTIQYGIHTQYNIVHNIVVYCLL
jgi:Golgi nucleoside diphosphatase